LSRPPIPPRRTPRTIAAKLAAIATAAVMSAAMVVGGAAAAQAAPTPTITATEIPIGGGTVTITGTGFSSDAPGIYIGLGPVGLPGFYLGAGSMVSSETVWLAVGNAEATTGAGRTGPLNADGSFTRTVTVPAGAANYAIYTSKAHGQGMSDTSQDTTTALKYAAPPVPKITATKAPFGGGEVTLTGSGFAADATGVYLGVGPQGLPGFYQGAAQLLADQTVWIATGNTDGTSPSGRTAALNADGSFSVKVTLPAGTDTSFAAYTSKAHGQGASNTAQNTTTALSYVVPAPAVPKVVATKAPFGGGAVTLTGSGFAADSTGVYLGVGPQGLAGFYKGTAQLLTDQTIWIAVGNVNGSIPSGRTGALTADGTFSVTVTLPTGTDASYAVYTSKAHGQGAMGNTSQDTTTALTYETAPVIPDPGTPTTPATPKLTVTPVPNVAGAVTVAGTGFATTGPGVYIGLGAPGYADFYAASAAKALVESETVHVTVPAPTLRLLAAAPTGRTVPMKADGSFSLTVTVPSGGKKYAIYSSLANGAGVSDPSQNVVTPLPTLADPITPAVIPSDPIVDPAVCVARAVTGATATWAIKDSFRSYIKGTAAGDWTLNSVGDSGGRFVWSTGKGSYSTAKNIGRVSFPGSVKFTGHAGALDITITNLSLRFTSATSANVVASFDTLGLDGTRSKYSNIAFATLAVPNGSVGSSALKITDAPTTLTAAGAKAFGDFYPAGQAMANLSLNAPLGASASCDESTLAFTGASDANGALLAAILLVGAGVAVTATGTLRRRRREALASIR
jgi:hypothetical protein